MGVALGDKPSWADMSWRGRAVVGM
jgi:hypothetical protein